MKLNPNGKKKKKLDGILTHLIKSYILGEKPTTTWGEIETNSTKSNNENDERGSGTGTNNNYIW